jgi:MFS family permease
VIIFLIGFTQTPAQFLFLRVFQGALTGTVAAATVLVTSVVPENEIGFLLGLLQTGIALGNSLGPPMGGYLADAIGRVSLMTRETLTADRYKDLPVNGAFILIDEASHQTVAAGMLR